MSEQENVEDVRLLTITETARRLNISRPSVYRLIQSGKLDVVKLDTVRRVSLRSVVEFAHGGRE